AQRQRRALRHRPAEEPAARDRRALPQPRTVRRLLQVLRTGRHRGLSRRLRRWLRRAPERRLHPRSRRDRPTDHHRDYSRPKPRSVSGRQEGRRSRGDNHERELKPPSRHRVRTLRRPSSGRPAARCAAESHTPTTGPLESDSPVTNCSNRVRMERMRARPTASHLQIVGHSPSVEGICRRLARWSVPLSARMATAREDWMTDTDPPNQEGTDEAAETPTYKSPLELILEKMPIFGSMFSDSGKSGGGGGSGRFEFSLEEMRELHRQFEYEVSALEDMAKTSQRSTHMLQPLAPDDASLKHYKRSQEHFFKLA